MGCFHGLGKAKADYLSELKHTLAPGGYWLMYGFFNPDADQSDSKLVEADLELIQDFMTLIWWQDGFDQGERTSAWFLFQKQN
jgi:cyclopropane fatty-acyl-phospholipid synthase-like methyltransferase